MDMAERLLSRISVTANGCFEWQGTKSVGYGRLRVGKNVIGAHRVSYETFRGPIPPGLFVCHRCDNPACINPSHLFLGTAKDNAQDALSKGRLNGHPFKMTAPSSVAQIRRAWKSGEKQKALAKRFGLSVGAVGRICRNKVWKEISP